MMFPFLTINAQLALFVLYRISFLITKSHFSTMIVATPESLVRLSVSSITNPFGATNTSDRVPNFCKYPGAKEVNFVPSWIVITEPIVLVIVLPLRIFAVLVDEDVAESLVRLHLSPAEAHCAVVVKFPFARGSINPFATVFTFSHFGSFAFPPEVFEIIDFDTRISK